MGVFEMIAMIVVVTMAASIATRWFKYLERTQSARDAEGDLRREVDMLRERVATLERIVTEPTYDLHKRFDDLRESRRAA